MDSLTDTTKIYKTQPGCRYAIGFEGFSGPATLSIGWLGDSGVVNPFNLADGTTTEDGGIQGANYTGGWEVLAVTKQIHAIVVGTVNITLVRVEN